MIERFAPWQLNPVRDGHRTQTAPPGAEKGCLSIKRQRPAGQDAGINANAGQIKAETMKLLINSDFFECLSRALLQNAADLYAAAEKQQDEARRLLRFRKQLLEGIIYAPEIQEGKDENQNPEN